MKLASLANTSLLIKLIAAVVTYGFSVLLARIMAPEAFGQIAFFLNSALLLSVLGARGQQMALIRFVPNAVGGALIHAAFRLAASGTVLVFLTVVCVGFLAKAVGLMAGFSSIIMVLGFALVLVVGWSDFLAHLARGLHLIPLALIPKEVLWRGISVLLIIVLFFTKGSITAPAILAILLTTLAALSIGQFLIVRKHINHSATSAIPAGWSQTIGPFWLTSVSNIFLANADVIAVGLILGPCSAGIYFAANRLAQLLAFFMNSTNIVIAPLLSADRQGDPAAIRKTIRSAAPRTGIPTVVFGTLLIIFAPVALQIFGPGFGPAVPALRLLALAGIVNAIGGPAEIVLNMCGYERVAMRISAASLAINLLLLCLGALSGNITFVALAVLVGSALRKVLNWAAVWRLISVRTDAFMLFTPAPKRAEIRG
ncbi:MAG: oligosaccharide flippase family protein [Paracoccaceae bacterium]